MYKLLQLAEAALNADEKCMLCSVVRLDGSGYGRIGARLLLTESGDREGYISGGCLEKDLIRRVWTEAADKPKLMAFDTRSASSGASRYNTGCQGVVHVLCQPVYTKRSWFYELAARIVWSRQSARVLSVYRSQWDGLFVGDTLTLFSDGTVLGTSEEMRRNSDLTRILHQATTTCTATLCDRNDAELEFSVELLTPPKRLVVFGTGDDVQPVVRAALGLGWEACVVGQRPEMTTMARFPDARLHVGTIASMPTDWLADKHTHALLMTHDMASDVATLPRLLKSEVGSIGVLGSKSRLARLITELYRRGLAIDPQQVERLRCPVGLDIGASSPEEIAVAIVAELIAMERKPTCLGLTEKTGPIHQPVPHFACDEIFKQRSGTCHQAFSE